MNAGSSAPGSRPSVVLVLTGLAVGGLFAVPTGYLAVRAAQEGSLGSVLADSSNLAALGRSLVLALASTLSATAIGTAMAWLLVRTDVPGRRVWRMLAPLPLVFPSFVAAAAFIAAVAPGGLISSALAVFGIGSLPEVRGFGGAWVVLTLFTYPYVYLPVAARFAALPPSLEESALLLGRRNLAVFRTVVLPQASSAIWAGALLVFLYAVSDFGAVDLMHYPALSREIFQNKLVPERWVPLSLLLALVAVVIVALERAAGRSRSRVDTVRSKAPRQVALGRWRWAGGAFVLFVLANSIIGPLAVLVHWAARGLLDPVERSTALAANVGGLWAPTGKTAMVSLVAAVVSVIVVLPVAQLTAKRRTRSGAVANAAVVGGFALPGLVVALALGGVVLQSARVFYQTLPVLVLAYTLHFGAQATRAAQVAVASVPDRLDDAARMLGASRRRRFLTIDLPLMRPGLLAGGGLVMLSVMKELPATLLLAPPSFTTLATRVWNATESGQLAQVGVASVILVSVSGLLTWLLVLRGADRFD